MADRRNNASLTADLAAYKPYYSLDDLTRKQHHQYKGKAGSHKAVAVPAMAGGTESHVGVKRRSTEMEAGSGNDLSLEEQPLPPAVQRTAMGPATARGSALFCSETKLQASGCRPAAALAPLSPPSAAEPAGPASLLAGVEPYRHLRAADLPRTTSAAPVPVKPRASWLRDLFSGRMWARSPPSSAPQPGLPPLAAERKQQPLAPPAQQPAPLAGLPEAALGSSSGDSEAPGSRDQQAAASDMDSEEGTVETGHAPDLPRQPAPPPELQGRPAATGAAVRHSDDSSRSESLASPLSGSEEWSVQRTRQMPEPSKSAPEIGAFRLPPSHPFSLVGRPAAEGMDRISEASGEGFELRASASVPHLAALNGRGDGSDFAKWADGRQHFRRGLDVDRRSMSDRRGGASIDVPAAQRRQSMCHVGDSETHTERARRRSRALDLPYEQFVNDSLESRCSLFNSSAGESELYRHPEVPAVGGQ